MAAPVILVTGGYDQKIRYWDATTGACTRILPFGESQVNCLQISLDKTLLAAGGHSVINLYDVNATTEDRPIISYDGHTSNVLSVGFQRDQQWIYSCSEDGTVRIWDPRANTTVRKYDCGASVNSVALHPNEAEIVSGDQNGLIRVWDLAADKYREEIIPALDIPVRSISIAPDASLVTVASHRGRLFAYRFNENKNLELEKEFQAHDDYLLKCLISHDQKWVATASADKTVKLWNTTTWEVDRILAKHQRWVWDCVFSADSMYLISASSDQSAKLWDLRTGEVARNYVAQNNNLALTCVALNDISC